MASKAKLVLFIAVIAFVVLSFEAAAARDLAETTHTTHQTSESANKPEGVKNDVGSLGYGGGIGYCRYGRCCGHYRSCKCCSSAAEAAVPDATAAAKLQN